MAHHGDECSKSGESDAARHAHRDEKFNQGLLGEPFVTGSSAAGGEDRSLKTGDHELTSGSGKDGEGAEPFTLGGTYDRNYTKPTGKQDFDAVHGHKTDIPWNGGRRGSGFDRDWQCEPMDCTEKNNRNEKFNQGLVGEKFVTGPSASGGEDRSLKTGDHELTSGSGKDGEGAEPLTLGGTYDLNYTKPTGGQDFDAVHGHKTDIPWNSGGQGSGFDKDWQYENKE